VIALHSLHQSGVVYRDLRPENVLLDDAGFIKLSDFGISKFLGLNEQTTTFCGASEYLSPEIILGIGYNKNTDWWSLGIFLYELSFGLPPFYHENTERLYDLICHEEFKFPNICKQSYSAFPVFSDFKDLVFKLLCKDPNNRLGSKNGLDEIKSHAFFYGVNFDLIINKKTKSYFNVLGSSSNFITNQKGIVQKSYDSLAEFSELDEADLLSNIDPKTREENLNSLNYISDENKNLINSSKEAFEKLTN
jgi:serum/glucocorticoid-regulated kinase 2